MSQYDIIEFLKKNEGKQFTGSELRDELKVKTVARSLNKLRHFGLVRFDIKLKYCVKGFKPVYVYWSKEWEDV